MVNHYELYFSVMAGIIVRLCYTAAKRRVLVTIYHQKVKMKCRWAEWSEGSEVVVFGWYLDRLGRI